MASTESDRPLRADARANRTKILDASRKVFATRGLDVSLDELALAAGVAVTTVTRRFADRDALIEALFYDELTTNIVAARAALDTADAGDGLTQFLRLLFSRAATDRGIAQVVLSAQHGLGGVAERRSELTVLIFDIVERARAAGRVREGVKATDIPIMMLMIGSVADFAGSAHPDLWQRYCDVLVDSVVPSGVDSAWAGSALSRMQLADVMRNWRGRPN